MFEIIIGFVAGLATGWLVLPAPTFITNLWRQAFGRKKLVERKDGSDS